MAGISDLNESDLIKKWKISFQKLVPEQFPAHHRRSFQIIASLGSTNFRSYSLHNNRSEIWRTETRGNAQQLVKKASGLAGNCASEYQWRLELEPIVYKRFELEIYCPEAACAGRQWRSEIEVVPETCGPISSTFANRREKRKACKCSEITRLKNKHNPDLNRLFSYRADEFMLHGGEATDKIKDRRPDRVQGLLPTERFEHRVKAINQKIQTQVAGEARATGSASALQFTPFKEQKRPLMFPFLISEAKTEGRDSFQQAEVQAAFPIRKLLRLQEELEIQAGRRLDEQGGPLVWFFSNRGQNWRLYGCYTDTQEAEGREQRGSTSYCIQHLWEGHLDSANGALQALLLVDYIFDWARDLYRPGISHLLKLLSANDFDNSAISTDSLILSLNDGIAAALPARPDSFTNYIEDTEPRGFLEILSERWQEVGTAEGVFRHSDLVEMCFQISDLRGDIVASTFASVLARSPQQEGVGREVAKQLLHIFLYHSVWLSHDTLSNLEMNWTGSRRSFKMMTGVLAVISYGDQISRKWQIKRILRCVIFDIDAVNELVRVAFPKSNNGVRPGGQVIDHDLSDDMPTVAFKFLRLSDQNATDLVDLLKSQSTTDVLANAIEGNCINVKRVEDERQVFAFEAHTYNSAYVGLVSGLRPIGRFCGSTRIERVRDRAHSALLSGVQTLQISPSLSCADVRKRLEQTSGFVLVHGKNMMFGDSRSNEWCMFSLDASTEPPSIKKQFDIISSFDETDGFYTLKRDRLGPSTDDIWRPFHSRYPHPAQVLSMWKENLSLLNILDEMMGMNILQQSQALKRLSDCTFPPRTRSKRVRLDFRQLKREMEEEHEVIEID